MINRSGVALSMEKVFRDECTIGRLRAEEGAPKQKSPAGIGRAMGNHVGFRG